MLAAARDCGTLRTAMRCVLRIIGCRDLGPVELHRIEVFAGMRLCARFHLVSTKLSNVARAREHDYVFALPNHVDLVRRRAALDQLMAAENELRNTIASYLAR